MKYIVTLFILLICKISFSQVVDTIEISYTKSAFLIFPNKVTSFDQGSEDVIIKQKDNKLIIQSDLATGFKETNLLVQCEADLYVFILRFVDKPKKFMYNYQMKKVDTVSKIGEINKVELGNKSIGKDYALQEKEVHKQLEEKQIKNTHEENCLIVAQKGQSIYDKGEKKDKISFIATNFYVYENYFYLKLYIDNASKIKYDIDFIRLTIRNKDKGTKPHADQYIDVKPVYIFNDGIKTIEGKQSISFIYVFEKFTIEDTKRLNIEMWEKLGDRILQINFFDKDILNAKSF
jgi:conjugative transposon TraN protein